MSGMKIGCLEGDKNESELSYHIGVYASLSDIRLSSVVIPLPLKLAIIIGQSVKLTQY